MKRFARGISLGSLKRGGRPHECRLDFRNSFSHQTFELYLYLLKAVSAHRVADRPDRYEPRKRKRKPRKAEVMTKPRWDLSGNAREELFGEAFSGLTVRTGVGRTQAFAA